MDCGRVRMRGPAGVARDRPRLARCATSAAAALIAATLCASAAAQASSSPSFGEDGVLPIVSRGAGCGGGDVSPAVVWTAAPADARSVALWMIDDETDARWVVYNLAVARNELRQGEAQRTDVEATVGKNADGVAAYSGPCGRAPTAKGRVTLTVVATDLALEVLPEGLTVEQLGRALKGHELCRARATATYGR